MKEKLSQKIDSKEKFEQLITPHMLSDQATCLAYYNGLGVYLGDPVWWAIREKLRFIHEYYEVSPVLAKLNNGTIGQHFVHISRQDRSRVALTMSTRDGEEDRQTIMSFGKYLRKYFLLLSDAQIAQLEAEHRAYVNAEVLFARTAAEIERVYTTMDGDTGCMRHPRTWFLADNKEINAHPSAVYEAPGMAVAYTQDEGGLVKSRSVVWVNPADESDKRYVRVYGDSVLLKLLANLGYQAKDLAGAKIRAIPLELGGVPVGNKYIMPYLDGLRGDQNRPDGTYGAVTNDGYIRLITADSATNINNQHPGGAVRLKHTCGYVAMPTLLDLTYTSGLTGVVWSALDSPKVEALHEGRVVPAAKAEVQCGHRLARVLIGGNYKAVFVQPTVPTFHDRGCLWVDTPAARVFCDMVELDPILYPASQPSWTPLYGTCRLPDGRYILKTDAVQVYPETGDSYIVHDSQTGALRKAGYIKCYSSGVTAALIHKKRESLRRTESGTVFDLSDTGDLRKLTLAVPEAWVGPRSYKYFELFRTSGYIRRGENVMDFSSDVLETLITQSRHMHMQEFRESLETGDREWLQRNLGKAVHRALRSCKSLKNYVVNPAGSVDNNYYNCIDTLDELKALVPKLEEGAYQHANVYRAVLNAMLKLEAEWELLHFNDVAVLPETETI